MTSFFIWLITTCYTLKNLDLYLQLAPPSEQRFKEFNPDLKYTVLYQYFFPEIQETVYFCVTHRVYHVVEI